MRAHLQDAEGAEPFKAGLVASEILASGTAASRTRIPNPWLRAGTRLQSAYHPRPSASKSGYQSVLTPARSAVAPIKSDSSTPCPDVRASTVTSRYGTLRARTAKPRITNDAPSQCRTFEAYGSIGPEWTASCLRSQRNRIFSGAQTSARSLFRPPSVLSR
jgi:hypothetical protein